jgi:hypothetical protein
LGLLYPRDQVAQTVAAAVVKFGVKFGDIGPAAEEFARAGQHDGAAIGIVQRRSGLRPAR